MYYPRESKKDFLYANRAYLFILIFVATVLFTLSFKEGSTYLLLSIDSAVVSGEVTNVTDELSVRRIDYQFTDARGRLREGTSEASRERSLGISTGHRVAILYSPLFPSVSQAQLGMSRLRPGFYLFAASLIFIAISVALSFFVVVSIIKHRADDKRY